MSPSIISLALPQCFPNILLTQREPEFFFKNPNTLGIFLAWSPTMPPQCCPATPNISSALASVFPYVSSEHCPASPSNIQHSHHLLAFSQHPFNASFFFDTPQCFLNGHLLPEKWSLDVFLTLLKHPQHLLNTTWYPCPFFSIPPSSEFLFFFSIPCHPLIILWT